MINDTLKQQILSKIEETYKKAEAYYGRPFPRPGSVVFRMMGATAGRAWYNRHSASGNKLEFNEGIAEAVPQDFVDRTVPYEVAHLLCEGFGGVFVGIRVGHGSQWKFIMERVLEVGDSSRCHKYDIANIEAGQRGGDQRAHLYVCTTCGHQYHFSNRRHNNVSFRGMTYRCGKCHGSLAFKGTQR